MLALIDTNPVKNDERYVACIETELIGNILKLKSVFANNTKQAGGFAYKFNCKCISKSGSAMSSQAGTLKAAPGELIILSKATVSFSPDSKYEMDLTIYNGGSEVAAAIIRYPR